MDMIQSTCSVGNITDYDCRYVLRALGNWKAMIAMHAFKRTLMHTASFPGHSHVFNVTRSALKKIREIGDGLDAYS